MSQLFGLIGDWIKALHLAAFYLTGSNYLIADRCCQIQYEQPINSFDNRGFSFRILGLLILIQLFTQRHRLIRVALKA